MTNEVARCREDLLVHAGFVRALARAALRGDPDCEDLEQDVWQAALVGAPLEPERQRPWLVAVLRHRAADLLRRRHRRLSRDDAAAREGSAPSAGDVVERAETGRRLVDAVLALEEPFRSAVLLRYQDGLWPRAIAQRLGIPVETARSRVRRGLDRLRATLGERERRAGRDARAALSSLAATGGSSGGSVGLLVGGALMSKKLALVAALLLAALGGWALVRPVDVPGEAPSRVQDAPPTLAAGPGSEGLPTLAGSPQRTGGPAAAPASADRGAAAAGGANPPRVVRGRVVGEDGAPVIGALLFGVPFADDGLGKRLLVDDDSVRWPETRSDADGRFEMPVTDPTTNGMGVLVRAKGYCLPSVPAVSGVFLTIGSDATITLKRGVELEVRVLDDATGAPIAGAIVALYRSRGWVLYTMRPDLEEATDGEGRAVLRLEGGDVRVVARAPHYAETEGEGLSVGGDGARTTVRLRRGGTVEVEVVDADGHPVVGARTALLKAPAIHLRGVTDPEGRVSFVGIPAPSGGSSGVAAVRLACVAVEADGFARTWQTAEPPNEGERVSLRIVTHRPRTISGRARYGDGSPAADLAAYAATNEGKPEWGWSMTGAPTARVRTKSDGSFEIPGVAPGAVTVTVGSVGAPTGPGGGARLDVPTEGAVPTITVIVQRGVAPVRVQVVDAQGHGVEGAHVSLAAEATAGGTDVYDGMRTTGPDGSVTIEPKAEGPWWLCVDAPGAGPLVRRVAATEAAQGPLLVRPGEGSVEGQAVRLDGSPAHVRLALETTLRLPNVHVRLAGFGGAVETDAKGRFLFSGVHDGVEGLRSLTPGLTVLPGSGAPLGARAAGLRVVLVDEAEAAALHVEVEVLDRAGQPVEHVQVELHREGEAGYGFAFPVPGSATRFRGQEVLAPGTWHVRAEAEGYEPATADLEVVAGVAIPIVRLQLRKKS